MCTLRSLSSIARHVRFLLVLSLSCVAPRLGYAECLLKPLDEGFSFSDAALESRDSFFASLCDDALSVLVIYPDPRLEERLQRPSKERVLHEEQKYPYWARRLSFQGTPVTTYVVEADGSVTHAITIQSSGHQLLDEVAVEHFKNRHFDAPGTLDVIGGGNGSMTRGDIVLHVINHTTYHRGHIGCMIYQVPAEPPTTDLPVFLRDHAKE